MSSSDGVLAELAAQTGDVNKEQLLEIARTAYFRCSLTLHSYLKYHEISLTSDSFTSNIILYKSNNNNIHSHTKGVVSAESEVSRL